MNGLICVGKKGKNYVYISYSVDFLKSFISSDCLDQNFNEKKYDDLKKGRKSVLTVIGEVNNNWDNHLGYLVSDQNGNLELLTDVQFENYLKNIPCMNYSLVVKGNSSYIRRNPKTLVNILDNDLVKSLFGFSFEDYKLRSEMTFEELNFCMKNNGFELGYREQREAEYFSRKETLNHLIYYNSEGTLLIFNLIANSLIYYHNECILVRHVDNKKFANFVRKNPYSTGSTNPIDGVNTDVLVISSQDLHRLLTISKTARQYSRPCKPYYISEKLDGAYNILILSPIDIKEIKRICGENKYNSDKFSAQIIAEEYVAFQKISRYSQGLQKLYVNYLDKFMNFLEIKAKKLGLSDKEYKRILKDFENFC